MTEKTNGLGVAIPYRVDDMDRETMLKAASVVMRYALDPMDALDIMEILFAPPQQISFYPSGERKRP